MRQVRRKHHPSSNILLLVGFFLSFVRHKDVSYVLGPARTEAKGNNDPWEAKDGHHKYRKHQNNCHV
jgi:hypothetical protein